MNGKCRLSLPIAALFWMGSASADLTHMRIWPQADTTRIVLESSSPIGGDVFSLDDPHRLVVDITSLPSPITQAWEEIPTHGAPIEEIRIGQHGETSRVVFQLADTFNTSNFTLGPDGQRGHRLVIDVIAESRQDDTPGAVQVDTKTAAVVLADSDDTQDNTQPNPPVVVVIDPGHGGRDPGAIGPAGTFEKDVVLTISQQIQKALEEIPGIEGVLTRDNDTYIGLRERTQVARRRNASLFVSIHADAAPRTSAQGGSVYVLSQRGASSETARWLASSESQAITKEDVAFLNNTQDQTTRQTLLDLSMGQSIGQSLQLGEEVLKALGDINELHKPAVERANFAVLRSPDIPSLLVETGFISNPEEEQRLNDPNFQAQLAQQIASAIAAYAL